MPADVFKGNLSCADFRKMKADVSRPGNDLVPGQKAQERGLSGSVASLQKPVLARLQGPCNPIKYRSLSPLDVNIRVSYFNKRTRRNGNSPFLHGSGADLMFRSWRSMPQPSLLHIEADPAPGGNTALSVCRHDDRAFLGRVFKDTVENFPVLPVKTVRAFVQKKKARAAHKRAAEQKQTQLPLTHGAYAPVQKRQGIQTPGHLHSRLYFCLVSRRIQHMRAVKSCKEKLKPSDIPAVLLKKLLLGGRNKG